ncbi:putative diphthamide synthesis protein-domain-containing protein [Dactylonectria estremocensis]|uniref:2-(3-amino-3-carboxypropyl)histidine synthase subunit 2 n=1 Tax=Dactylonectria estremocensis TaxID=1079267 RepID=A0A9P9EMD8_9HYPO|nr:putative diphthamide synthesis protein-domain-containing protein [Dactylonectria estremocensis]
MPSDLAAPPVLSTPDDNILEIPAAADCKTSTLSDDQLRATYEITRTAGEVAAGGWRRVGLQFPDFMLVDAPRVVEALGKELGADEKTRIYVLADSSYSACCVDEIAAEHVAADVVVHYGRTCLSPTSRLPAIYVYTSHELDYDVTMAEIEKEFGDKETKLVVMADLTYQDHVTKLVSRLNDRGYANVVATDVVRDPAALIPNRTILGEPMDEEHWRSYSLIHISDPPSALLLALQSRFASLHILSTPSSESPSLTNPTMRTAGALRRRFAKVLSLASAGVIGILVNTLSVANYLSSIQLLRDKIDRAGKKSYTVVVGKLNPAKLANFAEIEGWVVVGCWESGLVEDDASYWRPVITPFELEVALMSEEERIWGGEWWGGIEKLSLMEANEDGTLAEGENSDAEAGYDDVAGGVEGEESEAPEFDLRTGKLVSHSRPMRLAVRGSSAAATADANGSQPQSAALVKRTAAGELASINGVASPGAEFLRSGRTWTGLGTDFDNETSTLVEEGRSGIARGYHVGEDDTRH